MDFKTVLDHLHKTYHARITKHRYSISHHDKTLFAEPNTVTVVKIKKESPAVYWCHKINIQFDSKWFFKNNKKYNYVGLLTVWSVNIWTTTSFATLPLYHTTMNLKWSDLKLYDQSEEFLYNITYFSCLQE